MIAAGGGIGAWALALHALLLPFLYIVPSSRVLTEIERVRGRAVTLHVEASLSRAETQGFAPEWPARLQIDLHPVFGMRVADDRGGRWVVRRARIASASTFELPAWMPQLEVLAIATRSELESWLGSVGLDLQRNALGRCGEADCFVLGGRESAPQLWVDKETFQLRRWVGPGGRSFAFSEYRAWGSIKFPSKIEVLDDEGALATLLVDRVEPAPALGERDFSRTWSGG